MQDEKIVELEVFDVKQVKEIARLRGLDPENLTKAEFWCIVSDALINYKLNLRMQQN